MTSENRTSAKRARLFGLTERQHADALRMAAAAWDAIPHAPEALRDRLYEAVGAAVLRFGFVARRGSWTFRADPSPLGDFEFVHDDYDGPGDARSGNARTLRIAEEEATRIDEEEREAEEEPRRESWERFIRRCFRR